jgi:hypothetical protein
MKPPIRSQIKQYKQDGTIKERRAYAIENGNNIADPSILLNQKSFFSSAGINIENYIEENWGFGKPIAGEGILPNQGKQNVLVLVFGFWGYGEPSYGPRDHYINDVERAFNGFGNKKQYPYESVRNYYMRSSYGKQDIRADVYGWIVMPKMPFGYIDTNGDGINDTWIINYHNSGEVFDDFLRYFPDLVNEIDWGKYDNDRDGVVEGLYLIWYCYDPR